MNKYKLWESDQGINDMMMMMKLNPRMTIYVEPQRNEMAITK